MKCQEIMRTSVLPVAPTTPLVEVARRLRDDEVGFLPVCDNERRVLGVVTDRDLAVRACAAACPYSLAVSQVMSTEVVSCRPTDTVSRAEELMIAHKKSRIVVTNEKNELLGVISLTDIAFYEEPLRAAHVLAKISEREFRVQHP